MHKNTPVLLIASLLLAGSIVSYAQILTADPVASGPLTLRLTAEPQTEYSLEFSDQLPPLFWQFHSSGTTDISGAVEWSISSNAPARFFRAGSGVLRPSAVTESIIADEDLWAVFSLEGTNPSEETLRAVISALPNKGLLSQFDGTPISSLPALVTDADRRVRYLAATNENGLPYSSFSYFVQRESDGVTSPAQSVEVSVNAINDLPVATLTSLTMVEDNSAIVQLTGTDPDMDHEGDNIRFKMVFSTVRLSAYQVLDDDVTKGAIIVDGDDITNTNGLIYLELPLNVTGWPVDDFIYQGMDSHGAKTSLRYVPIYVQEVNDIPVSDSFEVRIPGNLQQSQFQFQSFDVEDLFPMIHVESISGNGRLYLGGIDPENEITTATNNVFIGSRLITFVVDGGTDCPVAGDEGENYLVIQYKAQDAHGAWSDMASATIHVDPRILPPSPTHPLSYTNFQDQSIRMELSAVDSQGMNIIWTISALPTNGSIYIGGYQGLELPVNNDYRITATNVNLPVPPGASYAVVHYVPDTSYIGTESWAYVTKNALIQSCEPIVVTFTVQPTNAVPQITGPTDIVGMVNFNVPDPVFITGYTITDDAHTDELVRATVAVLWETGPADGTLSLPPTEGLSAVVFNGTSQVSFKGTLQAINSAFAEGVRYDMNTFVGGKIAVTIDDLGTGSGLDGAKSSTHFADFSIIFQEIIEE